MKVELLAPGGSYENIIAAINSGADAVYTSLDKFGARAYSQNLSVEEMCEVIDYAHLCGKKIYLTVNTLLKNSEIENELFEYLNPLYMQGLDAVIVQDFGVLKYIKENFKDLHIHASTQMTIMGKYTAKFLKEYGIDRIVTPRELSLEEISDIKKNCDIEIESFVHGALCYCYSGQCLMSSIIGQRSGNRGKCAQPCRLNYLAMKDGKVINKKDEVYQLSTKDICTLEILPQIIESGVYSLKIEGRMKSKYYVAGVTSIYRKYIDMYLANPKEYKVDPKDIELLSDLFNRNGFSESYYKTYNSKDMMSLTKVDFRKENIELKKSLDKVIDNKNKKDITLDVFVNCNEPLTISGYVDDMYISYSGDIVTAAKNAPATEESIRKNISKFGNTIYNPAIINIYMDDNVFVPNSLLNKARREFVNTINDEVLRKYRRKSADKPKLSTFNKDNKNSSNLLINTLVYNKLQFNKCLEKDYIDTIYIENSMFDVNTTRDLCQQAKNNNKKIYLAMPYIFRKKDIDIFKQYSNLLNDLDGFLIRNIEEYLYLKEIVPNKDYIMDYNVYAYNKQAKLFLNNKVTSPMELNIAQIRDNDLCDEFIVYGNIPLMITANCIMKNNLGCNKKGEELRLIDRKNKEMAVKCMCKYCYNIIYNNNIYSAFSMSKKIMENTRESVRVQFSFENEKEVEVILQKVYNTFVKHIETNDDDNTTRGHLKRGAL